MIDPDDPAVFQLSGGTTGIPKLIPRTHNDYEFNSRLALSVCDVRDGDCLLDVLAIAHNLPLACPGLQGFWFAGARVVLHPSIRGAQVFPLIERHRVTHIHVVPALLIKWLNRPGDREVRPLLGTGDPERRAAPPAGDAAARREAAAQLHRAGELRHG